VIATGLQVAHAAELAIWTNLILIDHSAFRCLAHALQACDEILVQHLVE
jgi:hypothetical protein